MTLPIDDDRLAELAAAECICSDCEPSIYEDARAIARELMEQRRERERDVREHVTALHQAASRIVTIADEAFGLCPVEPLEATLTRIERGIFEQHRELEQLRRRVAEIEARLALETAALEQACAADVDAPISTTVARSNAEADQLRKRVAELESEIERMRPVVAAASGADPMERR